MPDGPEKGDDFDLPDRTSHNHQEMKFETRSTKLETKTNDPKLANSPGKDKIIILRLLGFTLNSAFRIPHSEFRIRLLRFFLPSRPKEL